MYELRAILRIYTPHQAGYNHLLSRYDRLINGMLVGVETAIHNAIGVYRGLLLYRFVNGFDHFLDIGPNPSKQLEFLRNLVDLRQERWRQVTRRQEQPRPCTASAASALALATKDMH